MHTNLSSCSNYFWTCDDFADVHVFVLIDIIASCVLMDEDMFRSHPYQRVYQYMHKHIAKMDLDQFTYQSQFVVRNKDDFLEIMLR